MDELKSVNNFIVLEKIFNSYMNNELKVIHVDVGYKQMMFKIIKEITTTSQYKEWPVKDLNKLVLTQLVATYKETHPTLGLEREQQVYGRRDVNSRAPHDFLSPQNTSLAAEKQQVTKNFENMMSMRLGTIPEQQSGSTNERPANLLEEPAPPAFSADEFASRLKFIENDRLVVNTEIQKRFDENPIDPKDMFNVPLDSNSMTAKMPGMFDSNQNQNQFESTRLDHSGSGSGSGGPPAYVDNSAQFIQSPLQHTNRIHNRFITINGFDRDWLMHLHRYEFGVDMNKLARTYRNIATLECTKIMIPMEILDQKTGTNVPKFNYFHEYDLNFPYLILKIDEFSDMYDGFNPTIQKGFATYVYENSYRGANGRGYIIMCPTQHEIKHFHPTPLAQLQRMTFSIIKPNGALFNNALDDYRVIKFEYEEFNSIYIKIVLDKWFDKNEFSKGDTVSLKNVMLPGGIDQALLKDYMGLDDVAFLTKRGEAKPNPLPLAYSEYISNRSAYDALADWANRTEGHEIVSLGEPNEQGYYKTFTVFAPGTLDLTAGRLVVNEAVVCIIKDHNTTFCLTPGGKNTPIGSILNMSLQIVLSLRVGTLMANVAPQLDVQNV